MPGDSADAQTGSPAWRKALAIVVLLLASIGAYLLWVRWTPAYNALICKLATPLAQGSEGSLNRATRKVQASREARKTDMKTSFRPATRFPNAIQPLGKFKVDEALRKKLEQGLRSVGHQGAYHFAPSVGRFYVEGLSTRQAMDLEGALEQAGLPARVMDKKLDKENGILIYSTLKQEQGVDVLQAIRWGEDLYPLPTVVKGEDFHFNLVLYAALVAMVLVGSNAPWKGKLLRTAIGLVLIAAIHCVDLVIIAKLNYAKLPGFGEVYYAGWEDFLHDTKVFLMHWLSLLVPAALSVWIAGGLGSKRLPH